MYPRVRINLEHITHNVRTVKSICDKHGIRIVGITKVFGADPNIAQCYVDGGLEMIGDARVANLAKLADIKAEKWLIRPPMLSEVKEVVKVADASLNSEISLIRAISDECVRQGLPPHKIVLMADLGDIREGYVDYDEMVEVAKETEALPGVYLYGIGVNLTCFSFITPDSDKMNELAALKKRISDAIGRPLDIVSGGNSGTIDLMMNDGINPEVDSLRLGESLLFGKERAKYSYLPDTYKDGFILEAEIVELKEKPSLPWGNIGCDSYGNYPEFIDRGEHRIKAILALGKQDFDPEICKPLDDGIIILGASSDHLMLDITDSKREYKVGDAVQIELGYFSVMRAFTSSYVNRVYE